MPKGRNHPKQHTPTLRIRLDFPQCSGGIYTFTQPSEMFCFQGEFLTVVCFTGGNTANSVEAGNTCADGALKKQLGQTRHFEYHSHGNRFSKDVFLPWMPPAGREHMICGISSAGSLAAPDRLGKSKHFWSRHLIFEGCCAT